MAYAAKLAEAVASSAHLQAEAVLRHFNLLARPADPGVRDVRLA